ncbi:MAG: response regulator [bacterium]|nr:response regulator [bacterium]
MSPLDVLVVEDEIPVACVVADVLERRGHRVSIAHSAERALHLEVPDILVCDVHLPGQSGFDLLEIYQARGKSPHTIFLTGLVTVDDCRRAMRLGALEVLPKPLETDELLALVEQADETPATKTTGSYRREYIAEPTAVDRAARDLAAYALRCGVGPAARTRIASACAEAVDNVVVHAYTTDVADERRVEIEATIDARRLVVRVRDHGVGFDSVDLGLEGLHRCVDGGLSRMCALAEDVRIDSMIGRGTEVELHFGVHRAHFDTDVTLDLTELDFFTPATARMVLDALAEENEREPFHLSPALAVAVGRLLAGPDPRQVLQTALWS